MNKLESTLSSFLGPGRLTRHLAQVLSCVCKTGGISYSEVEKIAKGYTNSTHVYSGRRERRKRDDRTGTEAHRRDPRIPGW